VDKPLNSLAVSISSPPKLALWVEYPSRCLDEARVPDHRFGHQRKTLELIHPFFLSHIFNVQGSPTEKCRTEKYGQKNFTEYLRPRSLGQT
jgi:hypothetical protein